MPVQTRRVVDRGGTTLFRQGRWLMFELDGQTLVVDGGQVLPSHRTPSRPA